MLVRIIAAALAERVLQEHAAGTLPAGTPPEDRPPTGTPTTGPAPADPLLVASGTHAGCVDTTTTEPAPADPRPAGPHVVVGYDARHRSADFAMDTARVLAARGVRVTLLARPLPTPVLAFAVRHLGASAGVMVTASHNPRDDNGYKLYWSDGAQLAAPIDAQISELIDRIPPRALSSLAARDHPLITVAGEGLVDAYVEAVVGLLSPGGARSARLAYTPLHGVGAETFLAALRRAGFAEPAVVASQREPDPDFPTAPFPNPEEAGVLDRLLRLAARSRADLAMAHDPDADRLAVAVPAGSNWRLLTGDEVGCLLAEHLLARDSPGKAQDAATQGGPTPEHGEQNTPDASQDTATKEASTPEHREQDSPDTLQDAAGKRRLVINTIVSSRLLHRIAADHGADSTATLTGFKWIMQARSRRAAGHDLVLGYEDALGYAVGEAVRDKDGISAALVVAELASSLAAEGRSLGDLLDDLHRRHGVHATGQRSIRFESTPEGPPLSQRAMQALREAPPETLAGRAVASVRDLAGGDGGLPASDTVILELEESRGAAGRVIVRPSGTEPKMKVYAEAIVATGGSTADADRDLANRDRDTADADRKSTDAGTTNNSTATGHGTTGGGTPLHSARTQARTLVAALLDDTVRLVAGLERRRHAHRYDRAAAQAVPRRAEHPAGATPAGTNQTDHRAAADRAGRLAAAGAPTGAARAEALRLVVRCTDLTTLEGDDTPGRIRALCARALRPDPADPTVGPVAAVCVYPALAALAAELLAGTPVAVASVAGAFPSGLSPLEVRLAEVRAAVAAGATEIDAVLNRSAFLSGHEDVATAELRALRSAAGPARLKVILEVCELGSTDAVSAATGLAIDAGADMVKTSTGKGAAGASLAAVLAMAETVAENRTGGGRPVGIKVAGGVRTAQDALSYTAVVRSVLGEEWLTPERLRFGASSLLTSVIAELAAQDPA